MLFYVFTTGKCNLRCKYCSGSFPQKLVPWEVKYNIKDLISFLEQDDDLVVAFYGGEPLLNPGIIREIMDRVNAKHFVIQTNGLLVKQLPIEYWRRFDTILLSIDGIREVTDYYRGAGVYDRVIEAAKYLRSIGAKADLVARMTVSEKGSIYRDVTHLLSLNLFDHVHWQLDVVWSDRWKNFDKWVLEDYLPGLDKLVKLWIDKLEKGVVLGIAPFLGIAKAMLFDEFIFPPCGSGSKAFAVSTDGSILACPIAVDVEWARIGHIKDFKPRDLEGALRIGKPCVDCRIFKYCGGRCLYAYYERLWGEEGFRKICTITKFLVDNLLRFKNKIVRLLEDKKINRELLYYPPFLNTIEVIP